MERHARTVAWQPPAEFDEYTLVSQLGRGRTGLVCVAHDRLLDRHVAVKFVSIREAAAGFEHEARAAARIQHPNVASLYRVGRVDGHAYLVWELVRGKTLDQLPRPVDAERVIRLAIDIARGLAAAHRRGVLHRDIKPGNIVVADTGEAKLVDFGLAALIDHEAEVRDAPAEPGTLGTPYFMSPEAWRREALDARSDLYSLGLVLYELLAGEGPFRHLRVKELAEAIHRDAPAPLAVAAPGVPAVLARVVDRLLRVERTQRYASADELVAALEVLVPGRGRAAIPEGNPYRGLRTYEAEHRAVFFGRGRARSLAVERLRSEALVVVTGDSGVGKSSLCAAGVVPAVVDGALEDGRRWLVGRTVPGRTPLRNVATTLGELLGMPVDELARTIVEEPAALGRLARAQLRDERGLLLYVDQLEELVTQDAGGEPAAVAEALVALADHLPGIRVLATARSDFLSRLAGLPGLAERLPPALLLLGPMSAADVREAIVGPAAITDTRFESSELVDTLVASTVSADGSLPLLQFTLAELWERRDRDAGVITAAALASVGGVGGALARHADGVLVALGTEDRAVARELLLRLVTVDDTRARRTEAELVAIAPTARHVLEALVRGRLLVASEMPEGATYEIAHEALVRGWGTLARWLAEELDLRAARHRLELAAAEWQRAGQRRDLLWSARQLGELDPRVIDGLAARERAFLEASRGARRRTRWIRRALVAVTLLAIAATWLGAMLVERRSIAEAVASDIVIAERHLDAGLRAVRARHAERAAAFTAWDRKEPDTGERQWRAAQARTVEARGELAQAAAALERALLRDGDRDDVRDRYGDVLLERALLADDDVRRDEHGELVERLVLYDADGSRRARLDAPATLVVEATPPGATVALHAYDGVTVLPLAPGVPRAVPRGSWLVVATAPGFVEVRAAVLLRRGDDARVRIALPPATAIPAGFVYIPAGPGYFGSSDAEAVRAWFNAVPLHPVETRGFLIARHETTFDEWIAFLDTLPAAERDRRSPRVAGTGFRGMLELARVADTWQITLQPTEHLMRARRGEPVRYADRDRRAVQDWTRFPVTGISYDDGVAFTAWLSRTARVPGARLCTEHEWEKAARGTSDRMFPHGDMLRPDDANFDETYSKRPGGFGPDEVGSHPRSTSPFGISDLAGNVWEWVESSVASGQVVARGGSYYFAGNTARITNRELPERSYRDLTVGLRVCADPRW